MTVLTLPHAISNEERHDQMQDAILRFPFLKKTGGNFHNGKLSIVCYGPSLNDTWRDIQGPILTVSGAHDFMVAHDMPPDYHVDCDPRSNKPMMLKNPQRVTKYMMASCCHPDFWHVLRNSDVKLWHLINGTDGATERWVKEHHPLGLDCMVGGGSTAGQRALSVAASFLGYRRFDVHGMDSSYTDVSHAGEHTGGHQKVIDVSIHGRTFKTSLQLLQAAQEMEQFLKTYDVDITFHGDGLMQTIASIIAERKG